MFGRNKKTLYVALPDTRDRGVVNQAESGKRTPLYIFIALVILVSLLGYMVFRYQSRVRELELTSPLAAQEQLARVVKEIGAVYVLPEGEVPVLALVGDVKKLPDQVFFANAKDGDQVLMYMEAKKAILWRPSIKKIVEIGPLSLKGQE